MPSPAPPHPASAPQTGRLRLLEALDALLVHGGVTEAARALAISPPAMSRLLAQLRAHYGDPLLVRAGSRRMVPTPFAQQLRDRVHAFTRSAGALLDLAPGAPLPPAPPAPTPSVAGTALHVFGTGREGRHFPRLVTSDTDNTPTAADIIQRREGWIRDADPRTRLAGLISALAGGQAISRPLRTAEAADAMSIILRGQAQAVQVGAFLAALQARGPTGEELAGLVIAARATLPQGMGADVALDWPAYTSPRNQRVPWFLLAVKALAGAGYRVALHGTGHPGDTRLQVAQALGIAQADTMDNARRQLERDRCTYVPLAVLSPQLQAVNGLYTALGMRHAAHLAVQILDPFSAQASILGAPAHHGQSVHRDAMIALGKGRLLSVSTHRDIAQAAPHRLLRYTLTCGGTGAEGTLPALTHRRPPGMVPGQRAAELCLAAWEGQLHDSAVRDVVTDTIALGLIAMGAAGAADPAAARATAQALWAERLTPARKAAGRSGR